MSARRVGLIRSKVVYLRIQDMKDQARLCRALRGSSSVMPHVDLFTGLSLDRESQTTKGKRERQSGIRFLGIDFVGETFGEQLQPEGVEASVDQHLHRHLGNRAHKFSFQISCRASP